MQGIVGYGFYIPQHRIKVSEIASHWNKDPKNISSTLKIQEKAVASFDEDSLTMGFESAQLALDFFKVTIENIQGIFFGSETPPYAVNPTSTSIANFLGLDSNLLAFDSQFACRAATSVLIQNLYLSYPKKSDLSLVIASDKANSRPGDILEYSAGSGSTSWIIGKENLLLKVLGTSSVSTDTPDFWRRAKADYPSHGGRFTGQPAYFKHIKQATENLLKKTNFRPKDFQKAVFHMPNGKFPRQIAKILGFSLEQIENSLVVEKLGNSYASSALMGLAATLATVKSGDKIFFCSYGSGAGSDAIVFEVTPKIEEYRLPFWQKVGKSNYLTYSEYLRNMD